MSVGAWLVPVCVGGAGTSHHISSPLHAFVEQFKFIYLEDFGFIYGSGCIVEVLGDGHVSPM